MLKRIQHALNHSGTKALTSKNLNYSIFPGGSHLNFFQNEQKLICKNIACNFFPSRDIYFSLLNLIEDLLSIFILMTTLKFLMNGSCHYIDIVRRHYSC